MERSRPPSRLETMSRKFSSEFEARYEMGELLGEGGMGSVYLARDLELERTVAIKFLSEGLDPKSQAEQRFLEEARICANLKHDHIVPLFGFEVEGCNPYLVFEHVPGRTLKDEIKRKKRLDGPRTMTLARQLLSALECAHAHNVIHRDIKPGNIMLRKQADGSDWAMILDFGMAKSDLRDDFKTKRGLILGTPLYMAPELIKDGVVDARTDLYAIGCTLYECLAGRPPFLDKSEFKVVKMQMKNPPPPLTNIAPEIDPNLAAWIHRALEKTPGRRYQTATEMLADLKRVEAGKPIRIPPRPPDLASVLGLSDGTGGEEFTRVSGVRTTSKLALVVGLKSLVRTQEILTDSFTWVRFLGAVLVLALGIYAWKHRTRDDPSITSLQLTGGTGGRIDLKWSTRDSIRGRALLKYEGSDGAGSLQSFKEENSRRLAHHVVFDTLPAGVVGRVQVVSPAGEPQWEGQIRIPTEDNVELSYKGAKGVDLALKALGHRKARLVLGNSDNAPSVEPVALVGDVFRFHHPLPTFVEIDGASLEVEVGEGIYNIYHLPPLRGLGARLIRKLRGFRTSELVAALVADPSFDKNLEYPELSEIVGGGGGIVDADERSGRDRRQGRDPILGINRPRAPEGYFLERIVENLDQQGIWDDLLALRQTARDVFAVGDGLDTDQVQLYHALLKLQALDCLILYHRQESRLNIEGLFEPMISFRYRLEDLDGPPTMMPLGDGAHFWVTRDYDQWGMLHAWARKHTNLTEMLRLKEVDSPNQFAALCEQSVRTTIHKIPDSPWLKLVLDVVYLGPAYHFEVSMRSKGLSATSHRSLRFLFLHPGGVEWYRAMDGRHPDPSHTPEPQRTGRPMPVRAYGGRMEARFPAVILPTPPLDVTMSYKSPGGLKSEEFIMIKRSSAATLPRLEAHQP